MCTDDLGRSLDLVEDSADGPEPGRCGQWMPIARTWCARVPHEGGKHRTRDGLTKYYADSSARSGALIKLRYEWLDAYKTENGCVDCGYDKDPRAIDFDHVRGDAKVGNISRLIRYASWSDVLAEIAKCDLRCACCHRIRTFTPTAE